MALLDRVQARVETDLDPEELQRLIDEALSEIEDRFGPIADPANPITVTRDGDRRRLDLARPIDADHDIEVAEHVSSWGTGETTTELAADDFRLRNGGRTLERLATGTNARTRWGTRVDVTYVPVNDGNQRQEVTIKLVQLAVEYEGVAIRRVGDTATTHTSGAAAGNLIYGQEREKLLQSLAPRGGMLIA